MAKFGWAYVDCADSGGSGSGSAGPAYSLQFVTASGGGHTTGSMMLTFHTGTHGGHQPSTLILSGNMVVTGTLSASVLNYENITIIDATGSTFFGNTNDDMHERTGSLIVSLANGQYILSASATNRRAHVRGFGGGYTQTTAATYTVLSTDYIVGCSGSGNQTLTLPNASVVGKGTLLVIKDENSTRAGAKITLTASAGTNNHIDGAGTYILTGSMPAVNLYTDGSKWFVF